MFFHLLPDFGCFPRVCAKVCMNKHLFLKTVLIQYLYVTEKPENVS